MLQKQKTMHSDTNVAKTDAYIFAILELTEYASTIKGS